MKAKIKASEVWYFQIKYFFVTRNVIVIMITVSVKNINKIYIGNQETKGHTSSITLLCSDIANFLGQSRLQYTPTRMNYNEG